MALPQFFAYDHDRGAYVRAHPGRLRRTAVTAAAGAASLALVGVAISTAPRLDAASSVAERQAAESRALRTQLAHATLRLRDFERQLDTLEARDARLYRTVLQVEPLPAEPPVAMIPEVPVYTAAYSASSALALRAADVSLKRLEDRLVRQSKSYGALEPIADARAERLEQLPALVPADGEFVSGFGSRRHPILGVRHAHSGVDIALPIGSTVSVTADGVVQSVTRSGGYGLVVDVAHPASGYVTRYAHLSGSLVRPGQRVERGQPIARSGNTGRSTGPHLHYEVRTLQGRTAGAALDPVPFLADHLTASQFRALRAEMLQPDAAPASLD